MLWHCLGAKSEDGMAGKETYNLRKVLEELDSLRVVHKVRHIDT